MSDHGQNLELVATDDLFNEIARRCQTGVNACPPSSQKVSSVHRWPHTEAVFQAPIRCWYGFSCPA